MRLYEEYLSRHKISVPLVHHCNSLVCVLGVADKSVWPRFVMAVEGSVGNVRDVGGSIATLQASVWKNFVLRIKWVNSSSRPGEYLITIESPVHDAGGTTGFFHTVYGFALRWHDYESALESACRELAGCRTYSSHADLTLALWEMFVYSHDTWFCRQGGEIKYLLYNTLDDERKKSDRISCVGELVRKIGFTSQSAVRSWHNDFLSMTSHANQWMLNLIGERCENSILQLS